MTITINMKRKILTLLLILVAFTATAQTTTVIGDKGTLILRDSTLFNGTFALQSIAAQSAIRDTIVIFQTGQSNAYNNDVAGDTTYAGWNASSDTNIKVFNNGVLATVNYYTSNIAGGAIVRENAAMIVARQLMLEKSNRTVIILHEALTNTALSSWTKAQTGWGEKDTVNTMYYRINAKLASIPSTYPKISLLFWQQGERDEIDTTISSWIYKQRALDSLYRASGKFSTTYTTIFCPPTTYYWRLRTALDSMAYGMVDLGIRDWRVARASFIGGVDLTHINNPQQYQLGINVYRLFRQYYPSGTRNAGVVSGDTATYLKSPNPTVSAGASFGLTNNFTRNSVFTGSTLFSFVPLEVSGSSLYTRILSGTGTTIYCASQNATTGQGAFMRFSKGGYTSFMASIKGEAYASGGGLVLNSYNGTTETEGLRIINTGLVGINNTTPTSTLSIGGSFSTAYVAKTATYTATASDHTIECTANTFTVTLPTAVGIQGRQYFITNSGAGTITIATTSSQTFVNVVGTPTTLTLAPFASYTIISNNAAWLAK